MKEYGVKESWIRLFSIASKDVIGSLRFVKPLAYSRSGNQVSLEHYNINLFWYDLNKKKADDVWVPGMPLSYGSEICLQASFHLTSTKGSIMHRMIRITRRWMISYQRAPN